MDAILDRLPVFYDQLPLIFWVLGSVLAYVLASNALWLVRSRAPGRWQSVQWIVEVGRFLFYLGIPYLALGGWPLPPFQGLLLPEDMGWVGFNPRWPATRWLGAVGTGLALGLGLLLGACSDSTSSGSNAAGGADGGVDLTQTGGAASSAAGGSETGGSTQAGKGGQSSSSGGGPGETTGGTANGGGAGESTSSAIAISRSVIARPRRPSPTQ